MNLLKIITAICLALFVKLFVFQPFIIPSSSMDQTLVQGDYVLVNKWQNNLFGNLLEVKNGQVIAFHYPLDKGKVKNKMVFIKRCAALPGDTLLIEDGKISSESTLVQFDYLISDPNKTISWDLLKQYGVHLGGRAHNEQWLLSLDSLQLKLILEKDASLRFVKNNSLKNKTELSVFPSDTSLHWNRDYYGPLYTPKKGATVQLNTSNFKTYKKIISVYENHSISIVEEDIYIDGTQVKEYTFEQNYYFMLGDNRHHSQDSRFWGFVPENHLIGSCSLVLFNARDFSLNRLFKRVY
tara:strand:- start:215 stop:1102 length:888 start_codon:yes stop_codon:yes gene_type:complete